MKQLIQPIMEQQGFSIYPNSCKPLCDGSGIFVAKRDLLKYIGIVSGNGRFKLLNPMYLNDLPLAPGLTMNLYPWHWDNYERLQAMMDITPKPCHLPMSFGCGDRLGMVTAAHITALQSYPAFPVVAQQSPRELEKCHRSFQSVLLDAVMGLIETGYEGPFGADADHIKDEKNLRDAIDAGYSMYTIDCSDWLHDVTDLYNEGQTACVDLLTPLSQSIISYFAAHTIKSPEGHTYELSEAELTKSALIYQKAMQQVQHFAQIISFSIPKHDLEVSIDEGARETTIEDHVFVAEYLHRQSVDFTSLAPKFPGAFQKGVDYVGDLAEFGKSLSLHAEVARMIGGYRLSLHSGSDKFSIYSLFREIAGGHFHLKTSGTSWLQAVKMIALSDPALFNKLYKKSLESLPESKQSYVVAIVPEQFPDAVPAGDPVNFFTRLDVRQLIHISYGVLLDEYRGQIINALDHNEVLHYTLVREHIIQHLKSVFIGESK